MGEVIPQRYLEFEKAFIQNSVELPSISTLASLAYQCNINDDTDLVDAINYLVAYGVFTFVLSLFPHHAGLLIVHYGEGGEAYFIDPFFLSSVFCNEIFKYQLGHVPGLFSKKVIVFLLSLFAS